MFCSTAGAALDEFKKQAPEVLRGVEGAIAATDYEKKPPVIAEAEFAKAPDIWFDYAVMEKAERRAVVRGKFDWNDIGSWAALADLTKPDEAGNRINGEAGVIDATHCFIQSGHRIVAALGVEDLLLLDTPHALLLAERGRAPGRETVVQKPEPS